MTYDDQGQTPAADVAERSGAGDGGRSAGAYRKLRELIVRGRLAPGSRIVETELAERLGVSRTPVRSALQRLRQEGYVVPAGEGKRSGNAVAPLTAEDAQELLYIMGMLEALAARRCAEADASTRAELVEELEVVNEKLTDAARAEPMDRQAILTLDDRFHAAYVEVGAGSRLRTFHEMVRPQKERYLRFYLSGLVDEVESSIDEHEAIVDGIRDADPVAAEEAVKVTWRNGADRLGAVIERRGEWGSW